MNKKTTKAIVLNRVNYGDSDRILTVLTPNFGKLSLLAKGARKINSKLAGGIELFAVFDAGFIVGRGEVGRLTSARLDEYYGNIIHDINRVQLGYEILKAFNHSLEDNVESSYFHLLCQLLLLLNESSVSLTRIELYFKSRLLTLAGHAPNLITDEDNKALSEKASYSFSVPSMGFSLDSLGRFKASHIKLLRLLFDSEDSTKIFKIKASNQEDEDIRSLVDAMFRTYL
ncbi:MAG TPA: DNA repair protein RecO [Candidatus Saccharimonadales bacterium]